MDCFLYDRGLRYERVNVKKNVPINIMVQPKKISRVMLVSKKF